MKHGKLQGVARNFADSFAGGVSFVVPDQVVFADVYAEAVESEHGYLEADFLTGKVTGARPGGAVETNMPLFANAFPAFCKKHDVDVSDFAAFEVRVFAGTRGHGYTVTIRDQNGKTSSREYLGSPGKRAVTLDDQGRRRRK